MLGENDKNSIVDRLMQIVIAESATVQTKNGPVENEATADKNSLIAAKSLGELHLKFLTDTAGLCASDDGSKIGESFARCRAENYAGTAGVMLNPKDQNAMLDRLIQILSKQTVTVQTKNGPVDDEVIADKNSIAAARFMIGLQTKYLKFEKGHADIVRLNDQDQKAIIERLMQIVSKRSVIVQTKDGPVEDHVIADKNAITSANLLFKLEAGTAGSRASDDGCRIEKSLARCESDETSSDAHLPVQDVLQTNTGIGTPDRASPHFRAGGEQIVRPDKSHGRVAVTHFFAGKST